MYVDIDIVNIVAKLCSSLNSLLNGRFGLVGSGVISTLGVGGGILNRFSIFLGFSNRGRHPGGPLPYKPGHKQHLNTQVRRSKSFLFSCRVICQECMGTT